MLFAEIDSSGEVHNVFRVEKRGSAILQSLAVLPILGRRSSRLQARSLTEYYHRIQPHYLAEYQRGSLRTFRFPTAKDFPPIPRQRILLSPTDVSSICLAIKALKRSGGTGFFRAARCLSNPRMSKASLRSAGNTSQLGSISSWPRYSVDFPMHEENNVKVSRITRTLSPPFRVQDFKGSNR